MRRLIPVLAIVLAVASLAASRAAQAPPQAPPAPAQKPLVPVAVNTVAANPDSYYGERVTLTAAVQQIVSRSAFSVAQRIVPGARGEVKDMLVIAPTLNAPVDALSNVTVLGEVVKFDPAEIERKARNYKIDLAPDLVEKYRGRPVVIATAVINAAMVDIAKVAPPPLTAEEEAYSKMMKRVGPAFAALRSAADASNNETATQNAAILKQAFTETEAFWKPKGKADALGWAQDAKKHAESIEKDAAAGKWDVVKASAATLGQSCQSCHGAYRERLDDGSYRIKPLGSR